MIDWVEYAPGCDDPGYECALVRWQFANCEAGNGSGCPEAIVESCASPQCVDADNDGYYGYNAQTCPQGDDCKDSIFAINPGRNEICDDGLGQDENCDGFANCAANACYLLNPTGCEASCDYDQDGHWSDIPGCGGDDCWDAEDGANIYGGFGAGAGGEGTAGGAFCGDGDDNDCDGTKDCLDSDCEGSSACPSCGPEDAQNCGFVWQTYCDCVRDFGVNAWNPSNCQCQDPFSPIVIDTTGNGFSLTNAINGVHFDINADGVTDRISWTSVGSDDVWLVLDRNGNNLIDDGTELFGNFTSQPSPPTGEVRNGFLALAVFDNPANGGNGDGQIDRRDGVFNRLRLWRDANHNGVSDAGETRRLNDSPIRVLELQYYESRRVDQYGNAFRYRAIVRDQRGAQVGRWAWDVFLVRQ